MLTLLIHDLVGVSLSWGSHGGRPLQENETALPLGWARGVGVE